ncbi:hypothetical protein [Actinomadura sp. 9N215]|uniref:hypothetical protein n=1 Tax=Actinomadura sp. 9N215 TaxID=3375150 RepID=UPI0037A5D2A7
MVRPYFTLESLPGGDERTISPELIQSAAIELTAVAIPANGDACDYVLPLKEGARPVAKFLSDAHTVPNLRARIWATMLVIERSRIESHNDMKQVAIDAAELFATLNMGPAK